MNTGSVRLSPGSEQFFASEVHSVPLGYERETLPAGHPLPITPCRERVDRLKDRDGVRVVLHGSLGDSLLALAQVRALTDYLAHQCGRNVPVEFRGPHAPLLTFSGLSTQERPQSPIVMTDRPGADYGAGGQPMWMCRPESVPCWSIKEKVQAALPERYYLATERRLGVRLPGDFPVAPLLRTDRDPSFLHTRSKHVHETTMAVITATSWPGRKDYTAERYQVLAQALSRHVGPLRLLIISGRSEQQTARIDGPRHEGELAIWSLSGATATELVPVLAHCELVVGNDTGLTHMAALSRTQDGHGPQVVGLYTRHSHSKWRTGLPWHHAMATDHSHRMHQGDLCPVRDQISDPPEQDMTRFSPALVAEACAQLLAEGTTP